MAWRMCPGCGARISTYTRACTKCGYAETRPVPVMPMLIGFGVVTVILILVVTTAVIRYRKGGGDAAGGKERNTVAEDDKVWARDKNKLEREFLAKAAAARAARSNRTSRAGTP